MKQQYTAAPTTCRDWLLLVAIFGALGLMLLAVLLTVWNAAHRVLNG